MHTTRRWILILAFALIWLSFSQPTLPAADYSVVVSKSTYADAAWRQVVDALVDKHGATVVQYESAAPESLDALREQFPRYACFVAQPSEAGREFVAGVHRLTRQLDDDPYTDLFWGILTGYDADCALRIAEHNEPLTIERVASGTELAMEMVAEGVWYCELNKNLCVRKQPGKQAQREECPDDTTKLLVDSLNDYRAQLFVTSGHATERDWQIGFRYRNGSFRCEGGTVYGRDTAGKRHPVDSPNPKVYMPIGNCLMGHVDSQDAMALAFMNSAGVNQMIGYTVPTWFGYAGWGCLDYFVEQPGRYTFTEAFLANQHALVHRLETEPKSGATRGLTFDRDVLAFYGDPAWQARMADGPVAWKQSLTETDGVWTLSIEPQRGEATFAPINTNGSQRGGRPIVAFLPRRVPTQNVKIIAGAELAPLVTDTFILVPNPGKCDPAKEYRVVFTAK